MGWNHQEKMSQNPQTCPSKGLKQKTNFAPEQSGQDWGKNNGADQQSSSADQKSSSTDQQRNSTATGQQSIMIDE